MKVTAIVATSADGKIGLNKDHLSIIWTTQADKVFFTKKTKEIGVLVMGSNTYKTFNKGLKDRRLIILTNQQMPAAEGVEFSSEKPNELIKRLESEGVKELAVCGGSFVYSEFLQQNLVDEVFINIMPTLLGNGIDFVKFNELRKLKLISAKTMADDTVGLHYLVEK